MIIIRLDEGISTHIAAFARQIVIPQGVVIETPAALQQRGLPDQSWMELLAKRGRPRDIRVAFSADNFTPAERALAETLKITLFSTPRDYWRPLRSMGQVAFFLRWLPTLIELAKTSPAGTQFRLPPSFNVNRRVRPLTPVLGRKVVRPGRPRKPRTPKPAPLLEK